MYKEFAEQLISISNSHITNPNLDVDFMCTEMKMSKTKLYQKIKK